MTDKTIKNNGIVGGDYFGLFYSRASMRSLEYYLNQFNMDDYWIFKSTRSKSIGRVEQLNETYSISIEFN